MMTTRQIAFSGAALLVLGLAVACDDGPRAQLKAKLLVANAKAVQADQELAKLTAALEVVEQTNRDQIRGMELEKGKESRIEKRLAAVMDEISNWGCGAPLPPAAEVEAKLKELSQENEDLEKELQAAHQRTLKLGATKSAPSLTSGE